MTLLRHATWLASLGCDPGHPWLAPCPPGDTDGGLANCADCSPEYCACDASLEWTFPAHGDANAYYRTTIEAAFSSEDGVPDARIEVGGVAGTQEWIGQTLVLRPDAPLVPGATYHVRVAIIGCADRYFSFTVGDVGAPIAPESVTGRLYALDLLAARWGDVVVQQQIRSAPMLLYVEELGEGMAGRVWLTVTPEGEDRQDPCWPTTEVHANLAANPWFASDAPFDLVWPLDEYESAALVVGVTLEGAFVPGGGGVAGAVIRGQFDTRSVVYQLDPEADEDALCDLLAYLGGPPCVPCPDGAPLCYDLRIDDLGGAPLEAPFTPIDDPCSQPECAGTLWCGGAG